MKRKLTNGKSVPHICMNCANGKHSPDGSCVLCKINGVTATDYHCGKFVYDPLNRIPAKRMQMPEYDPEDFKL